MIKKINTDVVLLAKKSETALPFDKQIGNDLLDTLKAHENECVGMAANMIGINKRVIVVNMGFINSVMYNPVILSKNGPFETEEGCLSLKGVRKCTRYKEIELEWQDADFVKRRGKFSGWTAQIIQHECDHLEGIII